MNEFNVIMIVLDGFRRDRLNLCPHLSKILRKGYFFSDMITVAPYTISSYPSIFTGLYPSKHGVNSYFNMYKFKKNACKTLSQYLKDDGYYTEANLPIDTILSSEGFDTFKIHDEYKDDLSRLHKDIIKKAAEKKFFLLLHNNRLHSNAIINVGKKYTDFDKEFFNNYEINKERYDSWLQEIETYAKEIYSHIKSLDLLKNTILIFLTDHGISNGEKIGEKMYGAFTYDYTIKVFSSFILPNKNGKEIKFQTRTIDIMPTVLDILNIKEDESYEHIQGKSLVPLMEGTEKEDRVAYSETGGLNGPWPSRHEHNVFCIRFKKWKLIYNKVPDSWEMYNLEKDPEEKNNIFGKNKELTSILKKMLMDHIKSNEKSSI